jgi:hypothetical protein
LKIPPFGALNKNIKIAQYCLHLTWKREKEEEMRFQKRQAYNKITTPKFLPVIPLLPTKLLSDEWKDKVAYITFTLQVSKDSGPRTPTYRKSIRTFEEGDPQQWMEVITGLKEIWAQNSITKPTDMSNTAMAILKGDSLCTMPKRQAVVIFPEVNCELSLVMENVKRQSWRRSTRSPKIGILVLIMHTAWSPNTIS